MIRYLSTEEEEAIKAKIVWENIEPGIREIVWVANSIDGIATVQSCQGHVDPPRDESEGFHIRNTLICIRTTRERAEQILFKYGPKYLREDVSIRYFHDGWFWLCLEAEPGENKGRLRKLFMEMKEDAK